MAFRMTYFQKRSSMWKTSTTFCRIFPQKLLHFLYDLTKHPLSFCSMFLLLLLFPFSRWCSIPEVVGIQEEDEKMDNVLTEENEPITQTSAWREEPCGMRRGSCVSGCFSSWWRNWRLRRWAESPKFPRWSFSSPEPLKNSPGSIAVLQRPLLVAELNAVTSTPISLSKLTF